MSVPLGTDLQAFSARYEGSKHFGLLTAKARALIRLQRSDTHIVYTMDTTLNLAFIERRFHDCSVLRIAGDRIQPLEYVHLDASDSKFNVRTRFDWDNGVAQTVIGLEGTPVTAPIVWPTWDPMSFQVALLTLAPGRAAGDSEIHRVIERGAMKIHRVRFSGRVHSVGGMSSGPWHEVVSQKEGSETGQIVLLVTTEPTLRPARVTLEGVTINLVSPGPVSLPPSLADSPDPTDPPGPQCRLEAPK